METYKKLFKAIRKHSNMSSKEIIDAGNYGADTGWPGFTYTSDCVDFYQANEDDIYELLNETTESMGLNNIEQLVASFTRSDMLSWPDGRKNLLAWFALEEVGRWLEALK